MSTCQPFALRHLVECLSTSVQSIAQMSELRNRKPNIALLDGLEWRERAIGREDRLGQPGADVSLARCARRLEVIERKAGDDRAEVGLQRTNLIRLRVVVAQICFQIGRASCRERV